MADASRCTGGVLLLAFAALYLATLDNGLRPGELLGGDLITHQYAQVQGRPGNAPGYPLYTMGGRLWFRAGRLLLGPDANPIPILSSYSTLWALVALGLLYALILEVTARRGGRGNWPVAWLVTGFYGVTYFFWYYAVTTEQYASSVAWTLAVVWLVFRWERERRDHHLLALALLAGVALAHQLTLPIILPPLLWWIWRSEPRLLRRPRLIAAALGLALLPLLSYLYVYRAGALHPEWRGAGEWASAWDWFWSFVSTAQGRAELTWSWTPFLTAEFPALIWRELTVPGVIAGLLGWAALGRRPAIALYATFLFYLILCWIDRLGNWYQVIMPLYALLALGIAAGADWLMAWGAQHALRTAQLIVPAALVLLLLYRAALSYPAANARNRSDDTGLAPGWAILADDPPAGAAILGTLPETAALDYLTVIWGRRPDLRAVTSAQARALL
ncbi:MAG: protein O-mannosyl-transferase family, partial [Anaerolineae bacterium]